MVHCYSHWCALQYVIFAVGFAIVWQASSIFIWWNSQYNVMSPYVLATSDFWHCVMLTLHVVAGMSQICGHKDVFMDCIDVTTFCWKMRAGVSVADVSFTIRSNHTQTGVIYLWSPTYSPTTLSVGFTGRALCSYTECCGLGGWVGLRSWRFSGGLCLRHLDLENFHGWKTNLRFTDFTDVSFRILELAASTVFSVFSVCSASVKPLDFIFGTSINLGIDSEMLFILRCLRDIITYSLGKQLLHSSTGLIDLSARPTHPICCGGALLFALVCFAICDICSWVCHWVASLFHIYLMEFSIQCDVSICAGHLRLLALCDAYLTRGGWYVSDLWT